MTIPARPITPEPVQSLRAPSPALPRYFMVRNTNELEPLRSLDGDFATSLCTGHNYVRQQGAWHPVPASDVYDAASGRGLYVATTTCWTQPPMRLSAALARPASPGPSSPVLSVPMRRDPAQRNVEHVVHSARARLVPTPRASPSQPMPPIVETETVPAQASNEQKEK